MIELEKLYEIADLYLSNSSSPLNWPEFAQAFELVFCSKMALYRPGIETSFADECPKIETISTTNPEVMAQFFADHINKYNDLKIDSDSPFEPVKRTDILDDSALMKLQYWHSFLRPHKIFYVMIVFAILPDGTFLVLVLWRDKDGRDFSGIEKQRVALFMRHLTLIVGAADMQETAAPDPSILAFGQKYGLTDSEVNILSALIQGQSLREIAVESDRSYGTVRWHVHNILEKCQVKTQQSLLSEFYRLIKR